ncbi:late embryogenesis abundant protein 47 [Sesamum indicum]|uniref:Late embryogenesis abundant protein 47 n=1 Tax=Sesamum indicum TaxID=4182 RepID=A0A6I9UCJ2_SESIN|nr:late embryogenesis abundant protein 47 [Sesamum indicum]
MSQEQLIKNVEDSKLYNNNFKVDGDAATATRKGHLHEMAGLISQSNAHNVVANPTEIIGVQVVKPDSQTTGPLGSQPEQRGDITIGEALEATALTAGHRPVDYSDAAAIQAAEVRATGRTNIVPGGVAAAAQSAATRNARVPRDEDKTKLGEILSDASSKLPSDKPVTRRDAEGVIGAELRNDPNLCTRPGGVAASVAAAARLNQTNSLASNNNNNTNIITDNNKLN